MIVKEELLTPEIAFNQSNVLKEVIAGLSQTQKKIHPKFLYDKKGSEIFLEICDLEEYYPTRTENFILSSYSQEMAKLIGPNALIIEPGSGAGEKIRYLLPHLAKVKAYVPIEISREILMLMTEELHEEFPRLKVTPICADFTSGVELPVSVEFVTGKKVVFFPGSTIGNFAPQEAVEFLKQYSKMIGLSGAFLIGADLKKDKRTLECAYDDALGVTAEFNLNLLDRLNREASANFNRELFEHKAIYNEEEGRVEMHLVSKISQLVRVHQTVFRFNKGESIHTESSYKYSIDEFSDLASKAKLTLKKHWTDSEAKFCVYYLERN